MWVLLFSIAVETERTRKGSSKTEPLFGARGKELRERAELEFEADFTSLEEAFFLSFDDEPSRLWNQK